MKDAFLKVPGWLIFWYLVIGQCIPAIDFDLGIRMGTQDSPEVVTPVGVAFWKGFCVADLVFYVPMLGLGLYAYETDPLYLAVALGITIYWPIVCLVAAFSARGSLEWILDDRPFLVVLPLFVVWACWCLWQLSAGNLATRDRAVRQEESQTLLRLYTSS